MEKERPLLINVILEILKLFKVSNWRPARFLIKD